jgi:hypothetical protein
MRSRLGMESQAAAGLRDRAAWTRIEALVKWWLIALVVWIGWVPLAVALFVGMDRVGRWINRQTLPPTQNPRIPDPRTLNRDPFDAGE